MVLQAWFYNETSEDQREEHKYSPNRPVSLEELERIGVLNWHFDPKTELDKVEELRISRNYHNKDEITISKDKLVGYEEKLKIFFTEHLHDDEEIRYIMEGFGYFDIRSKNDEWIRIRCEEGDMVRIC
jgi:1,2-dihydroxy-3-keto-5-methylthiopentene dioxygenase